MGISNFLVVVNLVARFRECCLYLESREKTEITSFFRNSYNKEEKKVVIYVEIVVFYVEIIQRSVQLLVVFIIIEYLKLYRIKVQIFGNTSTKLLMDLSAILALIFLRWENHETYNSKPRFIYTFHMILHKTLSIWLDITRIYKAFCLIGTFEKYDILVIRFFILGEQTLF